MYVLSAVSRPFSPPSSRSAGVYGLSPLPTSSATSAKQRPATAVGSVAAPPAPAAKTSGDSPLAETATLPRRQLPALDSSTVAKHARPASSIGSAGQLKDERLVAEHRQKTARLHDLWEILGVDFEARQRAIGNALVLAVPSWPNLQRVRQLVELLEAELEDFEARRTLAIQQEQQQRRHSWEARPSSRAARHQAALADAGHDGDSPASDATRRLHFSGASSSGGESPSSAFATPDISPVKQPQVRPGTSRGTTPAKHARPASAAIMVDSFTSTDLTPAERLQRAFDAITEPPAATTLADLEVEELSKRERLFAHALQPVDALFLLHCHRLIQLEEDAAEAAKSRRLRKAQLAERARVNPYAVDDSDDEVVDQDAGATGAGTPVASSPMGPSTAPRSAKRLTTSSPLATASRTSRAHDEAISPSKRFSDTFSAASGIDSMDDRALDAIEGLLFEEQLKRLRIVERGVQIPRIVHGLIVIQTEAEAAVRDLALEEAVARRAIEGDLITILTTRLDGPVSRRLHRLVYTGQYRIEAEERTEFAFILEDFRAGRGAVAATGSTVAAEAEARRTIEADYNEDVARLDEFDREHRVVVQARQAAREQTELGNISAHEAAFRTLQAQHEGDARDVISCEFSEFIIRDHTTRHAVASLALLGLQHTEHIQRAASSVVEALSRVDDIEAAAARHAVGVAESAAFVRIPERVANDVVYRFEETEAAARRAIEDEQAADVRRAADAAIQDSLRTLQFKETTRRDTIVAEEDCERVEVAVAESGASVAVLCAGAALQVRAEDSAATMLQSFGRRSLNAIRREGEQSEDAAASVAQERQVAAEIVTRAVRRAAARAKGLAFAARALKERREREELARFDAAQRQRFVYWSNMMDLASAENNARMDTVVEEGTLRLQLVFAFRAELEPMVMRLRQCGRVEAEEQHGRAQVEEKEVGGRAELKLSEEVALDVHSIISAASLHSLL